jgi:hypothetical protein
MATPAEYETVAFKGALIRAAEKHLDRVIKAFPLGLVTDDELDQDLRVYMARMNAITKAEAAVAASFTRRSEIEERFR